MRVLVLLGSVRRGRQSARVATFVMQRLARMDSVEATLADLDAIDLPVMEERLGRIERRRRGSPSSPRASSAPMR